VIVVADASPLRYLILIEHAHVLPALYGRVLIPPAVIAELNRERTPDLVRAWLAKSPDWLHVQAPREALTGLRNVLGDGERQAIALIWSPVLATNDQRGGAGVREIRRADW
jgi:predicted nucleic acid-binding protein